MSGLAVASFIIGVLGIFCFGLTGWLAVILGIIALVRIALNGGKMRGKGFAIAGIAFGVIWTCVILYLLIPRVETAKELMNRTMCNVRLQILHNALERYAVTEKSKGREEAYPSDLDVLVEEGMVISKQIRCASPAGESEPAFAYRRLENPEQAPENMVILHCRKGAHHGNGRSVLFTNGVLFMTEEEFQETISEDNRIRRKLGWPEIPPNLPSR
jgi:competence protein ComGC